MSGLRNGLASTLVGVLFAVGGLAWSRSAHTVPVTPGMGPGEAIVPAESEAPAGFREDAWFLPDDPLLGFVEVPAGPFLSGSDPARDPMAYDNEVWAGGVSPMTLELGAYYIGRFEVTVAQFRAFALASGYGASEESLSGPLDHPVSGVSWVDALAYCRWLEATLKAWMGTPPELRDRLAEGWRITLPGEAEWEKAARGTDGRIWPWGDEPSPERANYGGRGTERVGSRDCLGCPWGLSDMSGNVWEWTRDPFLEGPPTLGDARPDLEADALWVMRGGSFGDGAQNVRAALRGGADPGVRRPFIGFRVALTRR